MKQKGFEISYEEYNIGPDDFNFVRPVGALIVNGKKYPVYAQPDPKKLP